MQIRMPIGPSEPASVISLFDRIVPVALVFVGLALSAAWATALGYGVFWIVKSAF